MSILFVAAEEAELKPMAAHLTGVRKLPWPIDYAYEGIHQGRRLILAANGAGPKLAAQATEVAIRAITAADLSSSRLEAVVSTGYCGALDSSLAASQIVVAGEVTDRANGERFACQPLEGSERPALVLSQDRIAISSEEKTRLFQETGAAVVEMEAGGVAARAKRAGLPFYCIKVVVDSASETFRMDLNRMRTDEGRVARGKIVVHALARPYLLPELLRWKRKSEEAARVLGEFLVGCRISAAESEGASGG